MDNLGKQPWIFKDNLGYNITMDFLVFTWIFMAIWKNSHGEGRNMIYLRMFPDWFFFYTMPEGVFHLFHVFLTLETSKDDQTNYAAVLTCNQCRTAVRRAEQRNHLGCIPYRYS